MAAILHSAVLKLEIENRLATRVPGALSPLAPQAPRLLPTGVAQVDGLLAGGVPVGGISEFTGAGSAGRTSLAFSLLAEATPDAACAYVDTEDGLDPRSAAAAGVCLRNLLWVRFAAAEQCEGAPCRTAAAQLLELPIQPHRAAGQGRGHHHPRTETRGLDKALDRMLAHKAEARLRKLEGTPGHPNRPLGLAASEEQIQYDHYNARKADVSDPLRQADRLAAVEARQHAHAAVSTFPSSRPRLNTQKPEKPWSVLDKAIRATDQILQAGGFRVVVFDLASTPAEQVLRIPLATWFRFRRAAQESDAILLLLTQVSCARSSALCVLDCSAGFVAAPGGLLCGLRMTAEVARQRLSPPHARKAPGRAASWDVTPQWMRGAGR